MIEVLWYVMLCRLLNTCSYGRFERLYFGLLDPDLEGTAALHNVGNHLPVETAWRPTILEYLPTLFWELQNFHPKYFSSD